MPDREKVIKGLDCEEFNKCAECPYVKFGKCKVLLMRDAKELLKEQEAVKPKSKVRHGANAQIQYFCGNCMAMLHGKQKYCSGCGRKVAWE